MPFLIKVTLFFEQKQRGWTESWYWQRDTDDLKSYNDSARTRAELRAKLLGSEARIKAIRTSVEKNLANEKVVGDSYLDYVNIKTDSETRPADEPTTALLVIWRNQASSKRKFQFQRGVWDTIVDKGGQFNPATGDWQSRFDSWRQSMLESKAGWVARKRGTSAEITGYTVDDESGQVRLTCSKSLFTVTDPPKPQYVRINKLNAPFGSALNGSVLVTPESATICKTVDAIGVRPFKSRGTITVYSDEFIEAAQIDGQRIVNRKAGAPLLESRGRSRARARA